MKRRELSDDLMDAWEADPSEAVELLGKFNVGEYWEKSFRPKDLRDTSLLMKYVEVLRQSGLDIGKGDSEFGYRMPLPEKDTYERYLQVFKRR